MNLRILCEAEEEAQASAIWYDEQLDGLGHDFLDELVEALQQIERRSKPISEVGKGEIQADTTLPPQPISVLDYLRDF